MRSSGTLVLGCALAAPGLLGSGTVAAQANQAHAHVRHVAEAFEDAPEERGLLATALAEAAVVREHAGLAAQDTTDLEAMKTHTGHVLHALDPAEHEEGPGLGYGLRPAAAGTLRHIELAAAAPGASASVEIHADHIAAATGNVIEWADEMIGLAHRVHASTEAEEAAELVREIRTLAGQLVGGVDADGDGEVGWQEGEGGLEQAEQHVDLLVRAEGIGG